jgi:hypothetical protein
MRTRTKLALALLLSGSALTGTGCALFAAGAGAGAGIYLTNQGAESTIPITMEKAIAYTRQTFDSMGIEQTELKSEDSGNKATLEGKPRNRDLDVTVDLERRGDNVHAEVTSKDNLVQYDKDYSRQVLQQIVDRSAGRKPAEPTALND